MAPASGGAKRDLLEGSKRFRRIFTRCESAIRTLPDSSCPWCFSIRRC